MKTRKLAQAFAQTALIVSLFPLFAACVNGSAQDNITSKQSIQFDNLPAVGVDCDQLHCPDITASTSLNLKDALDPLQKLGDITLKVAGNSLSVDGGDLSFLRHVKIVLSDKAGNTSTLSDADLHVSGSVVDVPVLLDSQQLYRYFTAGEVQINFSLALGGTVSVKGGTLKLDHTLTVDVQDDVNKSVSDIASSK